MIARSQRKMFKNHNIGNVSFLINSGWKFGGFSGFFLEYQSLLICDRIFWKKLNISKNNWVISV